MRIFVIFKTATKAFWQESERDAALADMKGSRICALCAHWEAGINEPCMHCTFENNCFEWRGIKSPEEDAHD